MKYEKLEELSGIAFRRATGVKRKTFACMVEIVQIADEKRLKGVGRPPKLSREDQILMTLKYLREYRTYYHIGIDYGVSESNAFRIIRRIEDMLVASRRFTLPKRTAALTDPSIVRETIDCTKSPVERPQKTAQILLGKRKSAIPSRHR